MCVWILTCRSFASAEQQDNNPGTEEPPSKENRHTKLSNWPKIQTHYPYNYTTLSESGRKNIAFDFRPSWMTFSQTECPTSSVLLLLVVKGYKNMFIDNVMD